MIMAIIASDNNEIESVGNTEREELMQLLQESTYEERARLWIGFQIVIVESIEDYEKLKMNLLANQIGIDGAVNPGQREINRHVRKIAKQPA